MGKLKPFVATFISVAVAIIIIRKVSFLNNLVFGA